MLRAIRPRTIAWRTRPASARRGIALLPEASNAPLAGTDGSGPPWLFLLQIALGLPTALWAYKCFMLVLFQRKIIYLPSVPPGTRSEPVPETTGDLRIDEIRLQSSAPSRWTRQPVTLRGIDVEWRGGLESESLRRQRVVLVYLQGNAGTPLLRLPLFRALLRPDRFRNDDFPRISIYAVAPRSFWLSDRSAPTQQTVLADYEAALAGAVRKYGRDAKYVLYGHSLGGAAALLMLGRQRSFGTPTPPYPALSGLILENPLPSIPYMVRALYPQRWLPYHYLGPFAFDRWDALGATRTASGDVAKPPSLWIRSARDEIIPHDATDDGVRQLYESWNATTWPRVGPGEWAGQHGQARWLDVPDALHDTAYGSRVWRDEIRSFVAGVVGNSPDDGAGSDHRELRGSPPVDSV